MLITTEVVAAIPFFICNVTLLIALLFGTSFWETVAASVVGLLLGEIIIWNGLLIPGLLTMALIWIYFPYPLWVLAIVVLGYILRGWAGIAMVALAYSVAEVFGWAAEFFFAKLRSKPGFIILTGAEASFLDAYKLHASAIGAIKSYMEVNDEEIEEINWNPLFTEYIGALSDQIRRKMGVEQVADIQGQHSGSDTRPGKIPKKRK